MKTAHIAAFGLLAISLAAVMHRVNAEVPPNVPKNIRYQAAAGACAPLFAVDKPKLALRWNALALVNISSSNANAACAPVVDVSGNGNTEVGLFVGNNDGGNSDVTASCTMTYNTAGGGPLQAHQVVTVTPGAIKKVGWLTSGITFGGPITFICNLPPRASVMRVYTITQLSS